MAREVCGILIEKIADVERDFTETKYALEILGGKIDRALWIVGLTSQGIGTQVSCLRNGVVLGDTQENKDIRNAAATLAWAAQGHKNGVIINPSRDRRETHESLLNLQDAIKNAFCSHGIYFEDNHFRAVIEPLVEVTSAFEDTTPGIFRRRDVRLSAETIAYHIYGRLYSND